MNKNLPLLASTRFRVPRANEFRFSIKILSKTYGEGIEEKDLGMSNRSKDSKSLHSKSFLI
jgi:hypothetical protein